MTFLSVVGGQPALDLPMLLSLARESGYSSVDGLAFVVLTYASKTLPDPQLVAFNIPKDLTTGTAVVGRFLGSGSLSDLGGLQSVEFHGQDGAVQPVARKELGVRDALLKLLAKIGAPSVGTFYLITDPNWSPGTIHGASSEAYDDSFNGGVISAGSAAANVKGLATIDLYFAAVQKKMVNGVLQTVVSTMPMDINGNHLPITVSVSDANGLSQISIPYSSHGYDGAGNSWPGYYLQIPAPTVPTEYWPMVEAADVIDGGGGNDILAPVTISSLEWDNQVWTVDQTYDVGQTVSGLSAIDSFTAYLRHNPGATGSGTVAAHVFEFDPIANNVIQTPVASSASFDVAALTADLSAVSFTLGATGLDPAKKYYVAVRAVSLAGDIEVASATDGYAGGNIGQTYPQSGARLWYEETGVDLRFSLTGA